MKTNTYKDLIVYQKAYELALEVYKMTASFPESEKYGLVSQLRRCAVSVPSNIAEGYRRGKKEYVQFLKIAYGSCAEMETQISLSNDLSYFIAPQHERLSGLNEEVSKLLGAILRKMENSK